ncbi:hypothetical protein K474DRAFT_611870 [Panus rudis PR-1116 ss-1]|nr:hypothetical protein K474DRAFT_611870 [Panus rudis PR-1116 ss-1]
MVSHPMGSLKFLGCKLCMVSASSHTSTMIVMHFTVWLLLEQVSGLPQRLCLIVSAMSFRLVILKFYDIHLSTLGFTGRYHNGTSLNNPAMSVRFLPTLLSVHDSTAQERYPREPES